MVGILVISPCRRVVEKWNLVNSSSGIYCTVSLVVPYDYTDSCLTSQRIGVLCSFKYHHNGNFGHSLVILKDQLGFNISNCRSNLPLDLGQPYFFQSGECLAATADDTITLNYKSWNYQMNLFFFFMNRFWMKEMLSQDAGYPSWISIWLGPL